MSIDEGAMHWFRLRSRRSFMPRIGRLAEDQDRRLAFGAAMQQFEEQMTAAKVVTAATRPINLYYALVQAGLAITAAHADGKWRWKAHGLRPTNTAANLEGICVKPDKADGAFQLVAQATGSSQISSPVSIGAIWASLPDICDDAPLSESRAPRALSLLDETPLASVVTTSTPTGNGWAPSNFKWTWKSPVPIALEAEPCASFLVSQARLADKKREVWLQEQMAHYPSAGGWAEPLSGDTFEEVDAWLLRVHLRWPLPDGPSLLTAPTVRAFFDKVAPEYRCQKQRYLRPSLEADRTPPPTPLMTWWLLLYSFSMLARYFPEQWVAMLDLDESQYAVSLQYACEAALTAIPHLVTEALDGGPLLLMQSAPLL